MDEAHKLLLDSSDLPRRLDDARASHLYNVAMNLEVDAPSYMPITIATIGLGACVVFPWIGLAVAPDPPVWLIFLMAGLSVIPAALLRSTWKRWTSISRGLVRRELYAVLDRDELRLEHASCWYLTLWNRETQPFRTELVVGDPRIGVGDVGVAVFRDDMLVNIIKIPVDWKPSQ